MLCALINNNVVVDIKDLPDDQTIQEYSQTYNAVWDISTIDPQPAVGWVVSGNKLVPGPNQTAQPSMKITKLAFRERFTTAELIAVESAEAGTGTVAMTLRAMDKMEQDSTYIDLNRTDTIAEVNALVSMGLITSDRATQILTTIPTQKEMYQG